MGYITPKNHSKTPTNTLQKPPKNTSKYPPNPSQNTPKILPKLLVFSFFSSGGGKEKKKLSDLTNQVRKFDCFL